MYFVVYFLQILVFLMQSVNQYGLICLPKTEGVFGLRSPHSGQIQSCGWFWRSARQQGSIWFYQHSSFLLMSWSVSVQFL